MATKKHPTTKKAPKPTARKAKAATGKKAEPAKKLSQIQAAIKVLAVAGEPMNCKATKYPDIRQMLDKEKLDAVFVETTCHARVWCMTHALAAGVDVYGEKPLTSYCRRAVCDRNQAGDLPESSRGPSADKFSTSPNACRQGPARPNRRQGGQFQTGKPAIA